MTNKQKKRYTLAELSQGLDVTIQGDSDCLIEGVCTIQEGKPGYITFLMNPRYKKYLSDTTAAAVIVTADDAVNCSVNALVARDPYFVYAQIARYFDDKPVTVPGIHSTVVVGKECEIDASAYIGPYCVLGDHVKIGAQASIQAGCVIGERSEVGAESTLHANVTLYHNVKLGKKVIVASGTVIGSDGFGIAKNKGVWHKVPQLGSVIIGDSVEIGANCTIDRGAIGDTVIENGVKLDNLIQIGHNVRIGENTAMAAFVGVSGSTEIGKNGLVAGQAGFAGHLSIAENVVITGGTAVTRSIREPGVYSSGIGGLVTNQEWRKSSARIHRLDKLMERVKELEAIVSALQEKSE